jgi:hypothetical protein
MKIKYFCTDVEVQIPLVRAAYSKWKKELGLLHVTGDYVYDRSLSPEEREKVEIWTAILITVTPEGNEERTDVFELIGYITEEWMCPRFTEFIEDHLIINGRKQHTAQNPEQS